MNTPAIHTPVRGGFTLVELIIALVGAGALIVGLSSAIGIAVKATDPSKTSASATIEGHAALNDLLSDLEFALSFSEQTPNAITFTVPDRNGDSSPETIRYAWSGTPGAPLTRQSNGGTVATLVENVHVFQHNLPTPPPNRLNNPGMESGIVNWLAITGSGIQSRSTPVNSGNGTLYAWRLTALNESGVRQDVTLQIVKGTTYDISAWMRKSAATAPFDVKLQLRVTSTGSGEQLFATDPFVINSSNYLQVRGFVTPTWSGTLLSAYWEATGIGSIEDLYVDDAILRVKSTSHQYVNVSLQVGPDARSRLHSGRQLINAPL